MASTVFNLGGVKVLKNILRFQTSDVQIITGQSADPTVTAVDAVAGSIYIRTNGEIYIKNSSGSNTDFRKVTDQAALDAHINALTDAHDASAISNVPAGNLAATDVQSALNELQSDIDTRATTTALNAHINNTTGAHAASAISNVPSGNLAAVNVQNALNELQSDIDTRALDNVVIKKDGSVAYTGNQSMGGFKITSLGTPTAASDAATKGYVDNALEGLKPKEAVRAASADAEDVDISSAPATIDGVGLSSGDRVLLRQQNNPEENGIRVFTAVGAPLARATDFDSLTPIDEINKAYVAVQEGATNAGKLYVQYGVVTAIDVDPISFTYFNSVSGLIGGDGITVSGANISVDHDGQGLQFVANQLALELDGTTLSKSAAGIKLGNTAVTPGTYGSASQVGVFTVDQQGRLTSASNTNISITSTQVSDFNEAAQDAVGNILQTNAKVSFSYNDALNTITAGIVTNSLSNTDIAPAANIALDKLAAVNPNRALQSDGFGFIQASPVTATELGYLSGVTSAIQTQLGNKASTTLNNLGTTSINSNLLPDSAGSRNIGSSALPWSDIIVNNVSATQINLFNSIGGSARGQIDATSSKTLASGDSTQFTIYSPNNLGVDLGIQAGSPTSGATGNVVLSTGNASVNNNSGNIKLYTGTVSGTGVRGKIAFVDGSLAGASAGYVWTLSNASTGAGQWSANPAAGITTLVTANNASLTANTSNEVITGLTFAHGTYNGCNIEYRVKKGTLVRTGRFTVATDGTTVAFNDMFVETLDSSLVFEAVINGANINIRQTNTETGTINISFEQRLFSV